MRRRRFYASPALLGAVLPDPDFVLDMTNTQALTFSVTASRPVSIGVVVPADYDGDVERLAADIRARVDVPVSSLTVRRAEPPPAEGAPRVTLTSGPGRST